MNDLILSGLVKNDGEKTKTTSEVIAKEFKKEHRDVVRAIENLDCSSEFRVRNFAQSNFLKYLI